MRFRFKPALSGMGVLVVAFSGASAAGAYQMQERLEAGNGCQCEQGASVALSADGNTALVGAPGSAFEGGTPYDPDGSTVGAFVFVRSASGWSKEATLLLRHNGNAGTSVALSADGNTAVLGAPSLNGGTGAVMVFTRSSGVWSRQDSLVGTGSSDGARQGTSVSVSSDGNTLVAGGPLDGNRLGAVWVFTRTGNAWSQQGQKLVGSGWSPSSENADAWAFPRRYELSYVRQGALGISGNPLQGASVSLSKDGNYLAVGGPGDDNDVGAVWVWERSGSTWIQQGEKLVGESPVGQARQGTSVSLNRDGSVLAVGGPLDNRFAGAVWLWGREPDLSWSSLVSKLSGHGDAVDSLLGITVALDDSAKILVMGILQNHSNPMSAITLSKSNTGQAWDMQSLTRVEGLSASSNPHLRGAGAAGTSVAISRDRRTIIAGNHLFGDFLNQGVSYVFYASASAGSAPANQTLQALGGGAASNLLIEDLYYQPTLTLYRKALSAPDTVVLSGNTAKPPPYTPSSWNWNPSGALSSCPANRELVGMSLGNGSPYSNLHALLCGAGANVLGVVDANQTCRNVPYVAAPPTPTGPGGPRPKPGDWDMYYNKAECGDNEYVAGVSLNNSTFNSILCCKSASVAHPRTNLNKVAFPYIFNTMFVYAKDGGSTGKPEGGSRPDWDPPVTYSNNYGSATIPFYKIACGPGRYMVAVSGEPSLGNQNPPAFGYVHAALCAGDPLP